MAREPGQTARCLYLPVLTLRLGIHAGAETQQHLDNRRMTIHTGDMKWSKSSIAFNVRIRAVHEQQPGNVFMPLLSRRPKRGKPLTRGRVDPDARRPQQDHDHSGLPFKGSHIEGRCSIGQGQVDVGALQYKLLGKPGEVLPDCRNQRCRSVRHLPVDINARRRQQQLRHLYKPILHGAMKRSLPIRPSCVDINARRRQQQLYHIRAPAPGSGAKRRKPRDCGQVHINTRHAQQQLHHPCMPLPGSQEQRGVSPASLQVHINAGPR